MGSGGGAALPRRIAVAAIGIPAAFGLVYLGGGALVGGIVLLGTVGTAELFSMSRRAGLRPLTVPGYLAAAGLPVVVWLAAGGSPVAPQWALAAGVLWGLAVMGIAVATLAPSEAAIASVAVTVFAPLYTSGLLSSILILRHGPAVSDPWVGTWLVFLPLAMVWICDTLAMAGGSLVGGPKLAPVVSPNKTWSGAIAGLAGAVVVAFLYEALVLQRLGVTLSAGWLAALGIAVGVLGQVGDLAESLFKRSVGVKDSGTFFPGHGGVLDRLDSLYWALPVTAIVLALGGVL